MNAFDHTNFALLLIIAVTAFGLVVLLLAARLSKHDAPPRQPMLTEPDQRVDEPAAEQPPRRHLRALAEPLGDTKGPKS